MQGNLPGNVSPAIFHTEDSVIYIATPIGRKSTNIQKYDTNFNLLNEKILNIPFESQYFYEKGRFYVFYFDIRRVGFLKYMYYAHIAKPYENIDLLIDSCLARALMYNNGGYYAYLSDNGGIMIKKIMNFPKQYKEFFYINDWKTVVKSNNEDTTKNYSSSAGLLSNGQSLSIGMAPQEKSYRTFNPYFADFTNNDGECEKYLERKTCLDTLNCFTIIENNYYKVIEKFIKEGASGYAVKIVKEKFGNIYIINSKSGKSLSNSTIISKNQKLEYKLGESRPEEFSFYSYLFLTYNNKGYIFVNQDNNIKSFVFDVNGNFTENILVKYAKMNMEKGFQISKNKIIVCSSSIVANAGKNKYIHITLE